MKIALIDNGSLEPEAHRALRRVAAEISRLSGVSVEAISWKHSGRIDPAELDGICAWTLEPWVRAATARGEREFVFVPFFVSAQGAIGSYLLADVEKLQTQVGGFRFAFTPGLAHQRRLTPVVADQIDKGGGGSHRWDHSNAVSRVCASGRSARFTAPPRFKLPVGRDI